MNRNYAYNEEDKGFEQLTEFNNVLKLIDLGRTPKDHTSDASGYTTDGRYLNIEIKRRNQILTPDLKISATTRFNKEYTGDTIYIETHKVGDLLLDYVCFGYIPIYINFLSDGNVVVFNLSTLKSRPKKTVKKIYSELYQSFELSKRQELPLSEAFIYKKDENNVYKLIYRP